MILLSDRKLVEIAGNDRKKFLQSIITNDINKLAKEKAIFACLLNPQGKFLCDFFIYEIEERVILEINNKFYDLFINKINLYKLHSDVKIIDVSGNVYFSDSFLETNYIFNDPRTKFSFYRIIDLKSILNGIDNLDLYHKIRIENMLLEGAYDLIQDKSFILQYGYHKLNAIDFTKGCYVGQEVTTRSFRRGVIRKEIIKFTANKYFKQGDEYNHDNRKAIIAYYNNNIKAGFLLVDLPNL